MPEIVLLNKHQKKALLIELYNHARQGVRAETVHISLKEIANITNDARVKIHQPT